MCAELVVYEAEWQNISGGSPTVGDTYSIRTQSNLSLPGDELWVAYGAGYLSIAQHFNDPANVLYKGQVLQIEPIDDQHQVVQFKVEKTEAVQQVLDQLPELPYPTALETDFKNLWDARTRFAVNLEIEKMDEGRYSLSMNYYGNITEIITADQEGKRYAWLTRKGFGLCTCHMGKYLLPCWLNTLVENPTSDRYISYYSGADD